MTLLSVTLYLRRCVAPALGARICVCDVKLELGPRNVLWLCPHSWPRASTNWQAQTDFHERLLCAKHGTHMQLAVAKRLRLTISACAHSVEFTLCSCLTEPPLPC